MGHREQLLDGAKRCLLEKGYTATTARDIVRESGTNLASIGYHYGSKSALMREALFAMMGEWADEVERAVRRETPPGASAAERFETGWAFIGELFEKYRGVWEATLESLPRSGEDQELREAFNNALPEARRGLIALLTGVPEEEVTTEDERTYGHLFYLLMAGMIVERSFTTEPTPTGANLVAAMRRITAQPAEAEERG